ncbi:MAG TPA: hypothetical protein VGH62_09905 [Bradyrhizobium sp.]|jgi:hypothetical protein
MVDRTYLGRHAATLLKLARKTTDRALAAALIDKAADLQSKIDEPPSSDVLSDRRR